MKKNVIALAVAAAMAPGFAAAADSKVSGFADITYVNADADRDYFGDGKPASDPTGDGKDNLEASAFIANAEVDFASKLSDIVSVRVDTDFSLAVNGGGNAAAITGGPADSAVIEQAYFAAAVAEGVTVIGGVFNNPIGWQAVDVVDRYQSANLLTYDILDGQTALYGNNIAGVAVAGDLGPVTVTGAILNDIGGVATDLEGNVDTAKLALDKHSTALVVNASPIAGLDLELGYVTQEGGAGNVTDFNATYKNAGLTLGLEYLTAEKVLDTGLAITANYMFTPALGATVAYSSLDGDATAFGKDADTRTSVAGIWNIADNLVTKLEFTTDDKGVAKNVSTSVTNLRFIAKF